MNNEEQKFWDNFETWIVYWRLNVHRFIEEYLQIKLKPFQKILIYCMSKPDYNKLSTFDWFASRGLGKSWLTAVFAIAMAILYPGINITVASMNIRASNLFIKKIISLKDEYPNIENEIEDISMSKDGSEIKIKGGARIFSAVGGEGARGGRCQILICDERRQMNTEVITGVLLPFLTQKRRIPAYDKEEYAQYFEKEHNYVIYLTSIGYKDEDNFKEFESYAKFMASGDNGYNVFALPYEFGVESGIIDRSLIEKQSKENKTDIKTFQMEMEVIPFGTSENAIFSHIEVNRSRKVIVPLIEPTIKQYIEYHGDLRKVPTYVKKEDGEIRILSNDTAVASGKRNDNSTWTIYRLFNKGDYYEKLISYHKAENGMNLDDQILKTKRLWYFFDIDYVVIDASGALGNNVALGLGNVTFDIELDKKYPGFKTVDKSEKYDIRIADPNALPVMFCMEVSGSGASQKQADMSMISKIDFERNRIFMLIDEESAIDELNNRYGLMKLRTSNNPFEKEIADNMMSSFYNTTALVSEMLAVKVKRLPSGRITFDEGNSGRKDRLISVLYGGYFINKLEEDLIELGRINLKDYVGNSSQTSVKVGVNNPFSDRRFGNGFARRR